MSEEESEFKSTKQVLELIGLSQDEIDAFFHLTGRGPVMTGEIALLVDVSEERAVEIAKNLLAKGLVREVPGKTPFYIALPPYSALLNQIKQFKEIVKNIQDSTPQALQLKFQQIEDQSAKLGKLSEYKNYINMMKTNLPAQIKGQFSKVENELENVKKFQEIRGFILNLREIVPEEIIKEFSVVESRLEKIKSEISIAFEKQFRIGALKSMAEKIVSKIISEQFIDLTDYFREKFVNAIQNTLDRVTDQLASISDVAGEMSVDLGSMLSDIESGLKDTLEDLDGRISTVYEDIDKGIEELKGLFQREIYKTLEQDIMTNILNQLDLSERTMTEFWERSKKASMLSFKDVWFVRSVEGMKAQINDALTRLKARVLIITPKLEDIDLVAVSKLKKHINVRISTNFDWNDPKDMAKLAEIAKYPNITIRQYPREDLYAINRDFEEVVVCVAAKSDIGGVEVAGMGSIIQEHVKLFTAVIEDVWIQGKKINLDELLYSYEPSQLTQNQVQHFEPNNFQMPQTPPNSIEFPSPLEPRKSNFQVNPTIGLNNNTILDPIKQKPTIPSQPPFAQVSQPEESNGLNKLTPAIPTKLDKGSTIPELFDYVIDNLDKKMGIEIAKDLEYIRNRITEDIGYTSILNQISITIATLNIMPKLLSQLEIKDIETKINFWRKKANL